MDHRDWLDTGLKVLGAAAGIPGVALLFGGIVGQVLFNAMILAALAGTICLVLAAVTSRLR